MLPEEKNLERFSNSIFVFEEIFPETALKFDQITMANVNNKFSLKNIFGQYFEEIKTQI